MPEAPGGPDDQYYVVADDGPERLRVADGVHLHLHSVWRPTRAEALAVLEALRVARQPRWRTAVERFLHRLLGK